jgi:hypothetical protein
MVKSGSSASPAFTAACASFIAPSNANQNIRHKARCAEPRNYNGCR